MSMKDCIYESREETILRCYIQPGAKKNQIIGFYGDPVRLKIKIKAPPIEGRANKEAIKFLAEILKLKKNQIKLKRGDISPKKDFIVDLDREDASFIINSLF